MVVVVVWTMAHTNSASSRVRVSLCLKLTKTSRFRARRSVGGTRAGEATSKLQEINIRPVRTLSTDC